MSQQFKVNIVRRKGATTLVQYADENGLHRASIPSSSVGDDGCVDAVELSLGIPYGLPWEEIVKFKAAPDALANELRRRGIWTREDLNANPQAAVSAFLTVCGADASRLRVLAAQYEKQIGGK